MIIPRWKVVSVLLAVGIVIAVSGEVAAPIAGGLIVLAIFGTLALLR